MAPDGAAPVTARTVYRAVLLAFGLVGLVALSSELVTLLLLLLLAVIVAVPLSAAADRLERLGVPRGVGAPLTLVVALAVLGTVVALLVPTFVREGRHFVDEIPRVLTSLNHTFSQAASGNGTTDVGSRLKAWLGGYTDHPERLLGPATTVASGLGGALTGALVVLFTALFSAVYPESLRTGLVRLVPPRRRPHARHVMHRLATAYLGWLTGLAVSMVVLGTLTYLGLTLVGLPFALVFAVLTGIATVVPYYGAILSYIPPLAVALTISTPKALLVLLISLIAHFVEGNLVAPLIMARAVRLHPALVAAGVLAVERLIGVAGLIVAVPVLVTAKILVEELWIRAIESDAPPEAEPVELLAADAPPRAPRLVLPGQARREARRAARHARGEP